MNHVASLGAFLGANKVELRSSCPPILDAVNANRDALKVDMSGLDYMTVMPLTTAYCLILMPSVIPPLNPHITG